MSKLPLFMENVKITPGFSHGLGNAANVADRVSLENYERVAALITIYQAAADPDTITFHKATAAAAGTEDTTNAIPNWWHCEDVTVGTTADTWTKGTAVASGATIATSGTGGNVTSYYLIDIGADELPEGGVDYKFVEINMGGVGAGGNFTNIIYFLYNPRYAQAVLPSAQS
jgi:hypothetical protein